MTREDELEFLKADLVNIIEGMTICESILTQEERGSFITSQAVLIHIGADKGGRK